MITSASFSRERGKPPNLPFPIKQLLEYISVPRRLLLFILINLKTFKICGRELKNLKGRSKTLSSVKEKKCLPLFLKVGILGRREILLFCVAWFFNSSTPNLL